MAYHAPSDLGTALNILNQTGAVVIAGGTDVYPACGQGQTPTQLMDVTRIEGFRSLTPTPTGLRIGAAVTWTQIARAQLPAAFDGLKSAATQVGSPQIQNAGTVAGNICNASPAADGVPPLLTLDARVLLAGADGSQRDLPLSDFILGVRHTALAPGELVTGLFVPTPPQDAGSAFEKLGSRRHLVISIAMVAALVQCDAQGNIAQARVAAGACSAVAQRLPQLEAALIGQPPDSAVITPDLMTPLQPITDVRGSAEYRQDAAIELCARAIRKAAS